MTKARRKDLLYRRAVALSKPQHEFLESEADALGIHASELIRRAVDEWVERRKAIRLRLAGFAEDLPSAPIDHKN